jgi:DNA-binding transcriptional regulator of glucitol operon
MLVAPRWLVRHVLLVVALVGCFIAARWQFHRAVSRHSILNWSYTVEWVLFAGFALLCWGWFLRDELRGPSESEAEEPVQVYQPVAQPVSDEEDPELAAYNRYLAELNERTR